MKNLIPNDWKYVLQNELQQEYWSLLTTKVEKAYEEQVCYPPKEDIFNAFKLCSFKEVKVVILGQDPYHGQRQANGLCFSYVGTSRLPPSLKNIYKEISKDVVVTMPISNGDLSPWANQGVLLLNACLTVEAGKPNSHKSFGWNTFTDQVIKTISEKKQGVVFLLWGGFAQKKEKLIDPNQHFILKATHPSPLGANKGGWFDTQHFSKTNTYLKSIGKETIDWELKEVDQPPTLFTL